MAVRAKLNHHGQFSKTKLCRFELHGLCTKGLACPFAHDSAELKALPDLRGTKLCKQFVSLGSCSMQGCTYAHSKAELRAALDRLASSADVDAARSTSAMASSPASGSAAAWKGQMSSQHHDKAEKIAVAAMFQTRSWDPHETNSHQQNEVKSVTGLTENNFSSGLFGMSWPPGVGAGFAHLGLGGSLPSAPFDATWGQASKEPVYTAIPAPVASRDIDSILQPSMMNVLGMPWRPTVEADLKPSEHSQKSRDAADELARLRSIWALDSSDSGNDGSPLSTAR